MNTSLQGQQDLPGSQAQAAAGAWLGSHFRRDPPGGGMGWWLALEVDIELPAGSLVRPDLAGWRRERGAPDRNERPCRPVPDWICEIVSPSNRRHDLVTKVRLYAQARITHYWLLDPDDGTLTVYRLTPEGYLVALTATEHETVRPEPFDALDLSVAVLLGID